MATFTHRLAAIALAVLAPLAGTACEGDCAGVGAPAVRVSVVDFQTNAQIANGATLSLFVAGSPTLLQEVTGLQDTELLTAGDGTGSFDVVVQKPGYFPWTIRDLTVKGACTVETVNLTARLRRMP